jgi:hypothetical protein
MVTCFFLYYVDNLKFDRTNSVVFDGDDDVGVMCYVRIWRQPLVALRESVINEILICFNPVMSVIVRLPFWIKTFVFATEKIRNRNPPPSAKICSTEQKNTRESAL